MRKIRFILLLTLLPSFLFAQLTIRQIQESARQFNNRGDHDNAIVVLQRGLKDYPNALDLEKDLAFSLTLKRDFAKAKEVIEELIKRPDADITCFQLAGNVYKALEEVKDCEKMYQQGLKKFPSSGQLYSELGELYLSNKDGRSIACWEDGIRVDPNYAGNYYNASIHYSTNNDLLGAILYSEIYINMESKSARANVMKKLLWDSYKKLLTGTTVTLHKKSSPFWLDVKQTLDNASGPAVNGLQAETLTMIRTRFILDWFNKYAEKYPFRLFDHQRQLLQSGLFEAYDQWLLGEIADPNKFKGWTSENTVTFMKLKDFLFNRVFKIPAGQYYPLR
jgi:tetratricopeptide (TPR) repeat protein